MMSPTYKLVDIQAQIRLLGRKAFTSTAIATAQGELDMTVGEMIEFICSRSDTKCFKTMESEKIPGVWMDAYNWLCPNKTQIAYVKVSLDPRSKVVISLKEL
jgi:Motility quorum-sensing regulator, toxin of MqsA